MEALGIGFLFPTVYSSLKLIDAVTKFIGRAVARTPAAGSRYRQARFGFAGHVVYFLRVLDLDALQRVHWNINTWTDAEVNNWKQSQLSTYNAIAVAVRLS